MVRYRRRGDVALEALDHMARREPVGKRHRISHRLRTRTAVPDDGDSRNAEKGRASVLGVVEAPPESPERPPRQERSDHSGKRSRQFLSEQPLDRIDQPFARFERDVAGKAVADYHVCIALVDLSGFDIADEVERRRSQEAVRVSNEIRAFALLLTDRQQGDTLPSLEE